MGRRYYETGFTTISLVSRNPYECFTELEMGAIFRCRRSRNLTGHQYQYRIDFP